MAAKTLDDQLRAAFIAGCVYQEACINTVTAPRQTKDWSPDEWQIDDNVWDAEDEQAFQNWRKTISSGADA